MTNMIKTISRLTVIILLAFVTATVSNSQTITSYTKYVNTFIGTAPLTDSAILGYNLPKGWRSWAGLTFPGSSLPNAMVQLSPMTEYGSGAGYEYEDTVILGLRIPIRAIGIFVIFLSFLFQIRALSSVQGLRIKRKVLRLVFTRYILMIIT